MTELPKISDEMVNVFLRAAVAAGAGAYISGGQGRLEVEDEQVRAGLAAAALVASGYRREADVLREAADTIEAQYPTDIWLPESTSPDAMAAKGVRVACNQLRHMAASPEVEHFREDHPGQERSEEREHG